MIHHSFYNQYFFTMNTNTILSPEQVLQSHLQAIGSGNIDALMADYTEDSVFITPNGSFVGLDAIRREFTNLLAAFPPGSTFNLMGQQVHQDTILLLWSGESDVLDIPFAVDTFVIKQGKILLQTFAGQMIPK